MGQHRWDGAMSLVRQSQGQKDELYHMWAKGDINLLVIKAINILEDYSVTHS